MNNKQSAILLFVIILSTILPQAPAGAVPLLVPEEPYWHCHMVSGGYTCPEDSGPTMTFAGTIPPPGGIGFIQFLEASIACTPDGCPTAPDNLYVFVDVQDYHWRHNVGVENPVFRVKVYVENNNNTVVVLEQEFQCGEPNSKTGDCSVSAWFAIPSSLFNFSSSITNYITTQAIGPGNRDTYGSWDITYSMEPLTCDYQTVDILAFDALIDPTVEDPAGSPYDEQLINDARLGVEGTIVKLQTRGGPWGDGVLTDRYDTAISWDGIVWTPLNEVEILCGYVDPVSPDLMTLYFYAESETFYIRANDTAGNFGDNTEVADLTFDLEIVMNLAIYQCEDQYTYDPVADLIVSGSVEADLSTGEVASSALVPGQWYMIESPGDLPALPWQEGVENRYDTEAAMVSAPIAGHEAWFDVSYDEIEGDHPLVECVEYAESPAYARVYFQAAHNMLTVRANDQDANWANNAGDAYYKVYAVEFDPFPEACEPIYQQGDLLWTGTLNAQAAQGVSITNGEVNYIRFTSELNVWERLDQIRMLWQMQPLDWDPDIIQPNFLRVGNWYMLETFGGPWSDFVPTGLSSYEVQIGKDGTWYDLDTISGQVGVDCAVQYDQLGHYRVYFQVIDGPLMKIRVKDDEFGDNLGGIGYRLYNTTNTQTAEIGSIPVEGACNGIYSRVTPTLADVDVYPIGTSGQTGIVVPAISAGSYYSLTTRGTWTDDGSTQVSTAQISDDGGATWYDWEDYPYILCLQTYAGAPPYYEMFFRAEAGKNYRVRAATADANWGNNTNPGYFGILVHEANLRLDPLNTCKTNYSLTKLRADRLYAHLGDNNDAPRLPLVSGQTYAIKVVGGPYTDGGDDRYDFQLSFDDGVTWYDWNDEALPGLLCTVSTPYPMVYFTAAQADDSYARMRVLNLDGTFIDNTGFLDYEIHGLTGSTTGAYTISGNLSGCYNTCTRPANPPQPESAWDAVGWLGYIGNSVMAIPNWMEFIRCQFFTFFLWCPEHSQYFAAMINSFTEREPWATINRLSGMFVRVYVQLNSYEWTVENPAQIQFTAEGGGQTAPSLIPTIDETSPWLGGEITLPDVGGEGITSCDSHITYTWGSSPLVIGFCSVMSLVKATGFHVWMNIMLMVMCAILFLRSLAVGITDLITLGMVARD